MRRQRDQISERCSYRSLMFPWGKPAGSLIIMEGMIYPSLPGATDQRLKLLKCGAPGCCTLLYWPCSSSMSVMLRAARSLVNQNFMSQSGQARTCQSYLCLDRVCFE